MVSGGWAEYCCKLCCDYLVSSGIGVPVTIRLRIDPEDGFVSGAVGYVVGFDKCANMEWIDVKFENEDEHYPDVGCYVEAMGRGVVRLAE